MSPSEGLLSAEDLARKDELLATLADIPGHVRNLARI